MFLFIMQTLQAENEKIVKRADFGRTMFFLLFSPRGWVVVMLWFVPEDTRMVKAEQAPDSLSSSENNFNIEVPQ